MRRPNAGFTLLDTLVAALVMIIGAVGLLAMQLVQVTAAARGRQLGEATALMQQKLEELRLLPLPAAPLSGRPDVLDARGCAVAAAQPLACVTPLLGTSAGTPYTRTWQVVPTQPGAARIQVAVSWQDAQGQAHQVSFVHDR